VDNKLLLDINYYYYYYYYYFIGSDDY